MTRDESLTIVEMLLNYWRPKQPWTKDEISAYASSIQDMSAELTTHALARAARELTYPPSIAALREYVRLERVRRAPVVDATEPPKGAPLPLWVKRWICARLLYETFEKSRDMRRFPEQGDHGDLTQELMPDDAWLEEANTLKDEVAEKAFRQMTRRT